MSRHPLRKRKIIFGSFQLRLVASFVGLAGVGLLLQFLLLSFRLSMKAETLESGGELAREMPQLLLETFAFTGAIVLPILFVFGILLTFKIAGPIFRFERYLTDLVEGRETELCRIRRNDNLQDLCVLINRSTEPMRLKNAGTDSSSEPSRLRAVS